MYMNCGLGESGSEIGRIYVGNLNYDQFCIFSICASGSLLAFKIHLDVYYAAGSVGAGKP